jgi:hypothetical protein
MMILKVERKEKESKREVQKIKKKSGNRTFRCSQNIFAIAKMTQTYG